MADPDLPPVYIDEQKIIRVMNNLLDNAYKYSPNNKAILIKIERLTDRIVVKIQDSGNGMSADTLNNLFEPYHPYSNSNEHFESIGLGLAICKTYVKLHGGDIWVKSTLGKGTTTVFLSPIKVFKSTENHNENSY
jgi:signal transduction histidine kinase